MHLLNKLKSFKLPLLGGIGLIFALFTVLTRPAQSVSEPLAPPSMAPFGENIAGIGVIEPCSEVIQIGTEISGIVRAVYVAVGDKVEKGAPLFALDERTLLAQIKVVEAEINMALVQAQEAQALYERVCNLSDSPLVSLEERQRRYFASQLAQSRLESKQAERALLEVKKDIHTVRAPRAGEILAVRIKEGEFASAGSQAEPLLCLGDTSLLHVKVEVDEERAQRIDPLALARGFLRGQSDKAFQLQFVRFEPYIVPKQNLGSGAQKVDTKVLRVVYALLKAQKLFVGQQMDVFIEEKSPKIYSSQL
jgi:multidrug efflux pump subunit AcrA (membrane-fusion protein)